MIKEIKISNDFSRFPSGRYKTDGKFSGEHFREDLLRPSLEHNDKVIIDLNDVRGYGSSFLEEAFGGLIRNKYYTRQELLEKIEIIGNNNYVTYIKEIWDYIKEAENELEH